MPRRVPDYPDMFAGWNLIASIGSCVSFFSAILFIYILYVTFSSNEFKVCVSKKTIKC